MVIHRARLERKQAFLFRVVDIADELFAMAATASRTLALVEAGSPGATVATRLAEGFCRTSRRRVRALFRALGRNDDRANYELGEQLLAGEYSWIEGTGVEPASGEASPRPAEPERRAA